MKTIKNCRVIKNAIKNGVGYPEIYDNVKCQGYCTESDDEPCDKCKSCKYLIGGE